MRAFMSPASYLCPVCDSRLPQAIRDRGADHAIGTCVNPDCRLYGKRLRITVPKTDVFEQEEG